MSSPEARVQRGPVPAVLGRVLEPLYAAAIRRRNRRFDAGVGVVRLDRPVISVGNLSVGGTGKTPTVAMLVRELQAAGRRPCIAMRGYKPRRARDVTRPSENISDEAEQYKVLVPGVPVVAQPDRAAGLRALFASEAGRAVDCVVLDDGFQHRRLARDLDVVLIDASRDPFEDRLLPAGWLREPVESLARAGAVLVTHAEMVSEDRVEQIIGRVRAVSPRAVTAVARHIWTALRVTGEDGAEHETGVQWLAGRRVTAVCAIGNPDGFLRGVRASGAEIAASLVLPDHDRYDPATVRAIRDLARGAEAIVTTEKDWAKLGRSWGGGGERPPCPVARPRLEIAVDRGRGDMLALVRAAAARQVTQN